MYLLTLLQCLLKYEPQNLTYSVDAISFSNKVFSIAAGIGKYHGGGMIHLPNAVENDGWHDITVIKDMSILEAVFSVPRLYNGTILKHSKVDSFRAQTLSVNSTDDSEVYVELDGEVRGVLPVRISIRHRYLQVITG